jgi:hypothetical protein
MAVKATLDIWWHRGHWRRGARGVRGRVGSKEVSVPVEAAAAAAAAVAAVAAATTKSGGEERERAAMGVGEGGRRSPDDAACSGLKFTDKMTHSSP